MTKRPQLSSVRALGEHRSRRWQTPLRLALAVGVGFGLCGTAVAGSLTTASPLAAAARPPLGSAPTPAIEPQVCSSCKPPLIYQGGPVLSMNGSSGLTVTPVWWQPSGHSFPSIYEDQIDGYIKNVAAASGSTDNIFSVDTEYYDVSGGVKTFLAYKISAGTPITDTEAFPSDGCKPASGEVACITDAQLRTELTKVLDAHRLPSDLAQFYPVFLPPNVETQDVDGTTSAGSYCGYHRAYGSVDKQTIYGDMPYPPSDGGCDTGQAPNGNLRADGEVSTLAHELNEAITDPLSSVAWGDDDGNEIGDMCDNAYGGALGSTNPSDPSGSEYNQVINGHKYYTQSLFSNFAYSRSGVGKGCALSEALAEHPKANGTGLGATTIGYAYEDAYPTTLAADGKATSTLDVAVGDQHGYVVPGDHVRFETGIEYGSGSCGKLSSDDAVTNSDGHAVVKYTASSSNVQCWVLATEAEGGRSAEAIIYQGTTQSSSPSLTAQFPTTLVAAAAPDTFTMTATNPSSHPLTNAQLSITLFPGDGTTKVIHADQVDLSYSTGGPNSISFTKVPLSGSTGGGNVIQGTVGAAEGVTMAPHATQATTFRISVSSDVPLSSSVPLFAPEGYLSQVNSAAGGGATVGDTLATQVKVASKA